MTIVRGRWFPATVQVPDEARPRRRVHALLCEGGDRDGLHVFSRPGEEPDRHLPVDWARTVVPPPRQARNGVTVHLDGGRVAVVTPGAGCRCGALGRWAGPSWANTVQAGPR